MHVVLEVLSGPERGQRIRLRDGLIARFGQTEWADFSFPSDQAMSEFHFLLDCRSQQCVLHAMQSSMTLVNAQPVQQQVLASGDRVLAGETEFLISIQGMLQPNDAEPSRPPSDAVAVAAAALSVREICERLELGGAAPELATKAASSRELSEQLASAGDFHQALRVRAYTLGRRPAVAWGCKVVTDTIRDTLAATQSDALKAAAKWVQTPDEAHCRQAESAAAKAGYRGPGGLLAAAAFWSGDNIAPAESPQAVPPVDTLASRAVAGSLTLTLSLLPPANLADHYRGLVALADQIESGELAIAPASDDN